MQLCNFLFRILQLIADFSTNLPRLAKGSSFKRKRTKENPAQMQQSGVGQRNFIQSYPIQRGEITISFNATTFNQISMNLNHSPQKPNGDKYR